VISALSVSGLEADSFVFLGFLPRRRGRRKRALREAASLNKTVVLYESPHRLPALLEEIQAELGEVEMVLAREMTKLYEEVREGPVGELRRMLAERPLKGEITLVLKPVPHAKPGEDGPDGLR
jgi:16S rRNA (cytidine1402-2'-O)-methyltransferase